MSVSFYFSLLLGEPNSIYGITAAKYFNPSNNLIRIELNVKCMPLAYKVYETVA